MPRFITKKWHGYHMVIMLCFVLLLLTCISMYRIWYGGIGFFLFGLLLVLVYYAERSFRKDFTEYISTLTYRIENAGAQVLDTLPVGVILYNEEGTISWVNQFVTEISSAQQLIGENVGDVFGDLKSQEADSEALFQIQLQDRMLEVIHDPGNRFYFLQDVSQLYQVEQRRKEEQVVLGFLHMDNYDEVGQGLSDQESTLLFSNVTSVISKWALEHSITLKRIDTDKMFFVTQHKSLDRLIQNRFDILDAVREITRKNKIPITLSMGVASVGQTVVEKTKNAQAALDMSLARGGDQAAVRNGEKILFFGGKTNAVEKRTRVRARVISHAMKNLIRDSERVVVMGHVQPDMDALGSAIGVVRFSLANDCEAYIVLDESNHFIDRLLAEIEEHDYLGEHIISPEKAAQFIDDPETLLVLVDTHKPSLVMVPSLMDRAHRIVVIDHHRRGEDFIEDPVLVYLEPYASSTCELVTELLQYQEDNELGMDTLEATALFAGIVVDTKNFATRAGSRTFEAASFLRRHGADLAMVQSLLKEDLSQFVKRAEIVKNTQVLFGNIAIALGEERENYDQLIIAQAADTLLNMQGIRAAFVIARRDNLVSVSARSHGDVNVQVMMERMGGGGHLTHAACQIKERSLQETKKQLTDIIEDISSGGAELE